jgi:hypothetical protein
MPLAETLRTFPVAGSVGLDAWREIVMLRVLAQTLGLDMRQEMRY